MEVLISKALIKSNITHDDFFFNKTCFKKYDIIKEEIKNLKT